MTFSQGKHNGNHKHFIITETLLNVNITLTLVSFYSKHRLEFTHKINML